jgi:hypothetical protein
MGGPPGRWRLFRILGADGVLIPSEGFIMDDAHLGATAPAWARRRGHDGALSSVVGAVPRCGG